MGRFRAVSSRFIVGFNSGQNRIQRSAGNIAKRFVGCFRETAMGPGCQSFSTLLGGSRGVPRRVLGQTPRHLFLVLATDTMLHHTVQVVEQGRPEATRKCLDRADCTNDLPLPVTRRQGALDGGDRRIIHVGDVLREK